MVGCVYAHVLRKGGTKPVRRCRFYTDSVTTHTSIHAYNDMHKYAYYNVYPIVPDVTDAVIAVRACDIMCRHYSDIYIYIYIYMVARMCAYARIGIH